jgi:DNA-binding NarL/FixJ family response regulator
MLNWIYQKIHARNLKIYLMSRTKEKMEKIRVFLSDPQVLFREGIHFILSGEDDFEVTGETTSNEEAFPLIEANPPHVTILSLQDTAMDGCEITRRIKRSLPSVSVILTMDKKDEEKLFQALRCGASACLTKDTEPDFLLNVIRVVAQGSLPIVDELLLPGLAARVLEEFKDVVTVNRQVDNLLANITSKESQVLSAIAGGSSLEQTAAKLDISEEVVRRNLRMVQNKLVNNDQAHIVFEAAQRSMPILIRGKTSRDAAAGQYVTRAEFNEFKESLMARFKSFISDKS